MSATSFPETPRGWIGGNLFASHLEITIKYPPKSRSSFEMGQSKVQNRTVSHESSLPEIIWRTEISLTLLSNDIVSREHFFYYHGRCCYRYNSAAVDIKTGEKIKSSSSVVPIISPPPFQFTWRAAKNDPECFMGMQKGWKNSTPTRFELAHSKSTSLAGPRLNHSATVSTSLF